MGYLEITYGPMFSGKTTSLVDNTSRYISINKRKKIPFKVGVISNTIDDRDTVNKDGLSPHTNKTIVGEKTVFRTKNLKSIDVDGYDYLVIDESQFFPDLVTMVKKWVGEGKHVHCYGLISDANKERFGDMIELFPMADSVFQLKAYCIYCNEKYANAPFTASIKEKKSQIEVGGEEDYIPVCGKHYK